MVLRQGRCTAVNYADKSVSKPGTYYVKRDARNIFFTEADLYE